MKLTRKNVDVMIAANRQPGWRPSWRGALKQCREFEAAGMMKECGVSAMPPHVVFCLTGAGVAALAVYRGHNG